jgi:hypothetical protein
MVVVAEPVRWAAMVPVGLLLPTLKAPTAQVAQVEVLQLLGLPGVEPYRDIHQQ